MYRAVTIILTVLLCCGCSGGADFVPEPGPFSANFVDANGATIGAFSFTVLNNTLQGTGILNHGGSNITVTISAGVNGKVINGTVNNSTFGSGPFWGTFNNVSFAQGGFNFTGNAGVTTTVGSWSALLP